MALMFGICLLHSITFSQGERWLSLWRVLHLCVDGFAFLSGWYGLRFRPAKVVRLYALAIGCGMIVLAAGHLTGRFPLQWSGEGLKAVHHACFGPWFLNAYLVLMLLAPLVDGVLAWVPKRHWPAVVVPPLLLTFGWSFARDTRYLTLLMPRSAGVTSYTGLTLLGVYLLARLWRLGGWDRFLAGRRLWWAIALLLLATACGAYCYASPFAALLAGCLFLACRRVTWPAWLMRTAGFWGGSMFAVYLLHCNRLGLSLYEPLEQALMTQLHLPRYAAYFPATLVIFGACALLDLPRRLLLAATARFWQAPLAWLDGCYRRWIGPEPDMPRPEP